MALVEIDVNVIYFLFVMAVIAMIGGLIIGYAVLRRMTGPIAQQFMVARRRVQSLVLQLAPNNLWRFIPVIKKFGNIWYTEEGPIRVTAAHVHPTVGLLPTVIENTVAADPNDDFAFYANQLAAQNQNKLPSLVDIIVFLKDREKSLKDILGVVVDIKNGRLTTREAVETIMEKREVPREDGFAYQSILNRIEVAIETDGKEYVDELERVTKALKISVQPKDFELVRSESGDIVDVVSNEVLEADDFISLTPAGTVADVQTVAQRNEAVAVKEAMFTMPQAMLWITIGVVIFIVLAGVAFLIRVGFH
jgi:hypothetical protein